MKFKEVYKFFSDGYQNLLLEYKVDLKPRYGQGLPPHTMLYDIINGKRKDYVYILEKMLSFSSNIHEIGQYSENTDPKEPVWNNGFLPGLDIAGLYTLFSILNPVKFVEIGSGNSTKVAFKAKTDNGLSTEIVSIDPQPRSEIDKLADKIIRTQCENTNLKFISELKENDILFIDNSHRILPNSDSMVFFMEILPNLRKGVIVHLHDIYLPYDYPQFMCDRFYSEQYGLAIYLLADPQRYVPLLPNYFISQDEELRSIVEPIWDHANLKDVERHGGSFWLKIME